MRYVFRSVATVRTTAGKRLLADHDEHQGRAFQTVIELVDTAAVRWPQFETVLSNLDKAIKIAYQDQDTSESDRATMEKQMLITTHLPRILLPALDDLFTRSLPRLAAEINPAALYFRDHRWLGLSDDARTRAYVKQHRLDVVRKTPLSLRRRPATAATTGAAAAAAPAPVRLRRCPRCAAFMEDPSTNPAMQARGVGGVGGAAGPIWMMLQKTCICGSMWVVVEEEEGEGEGGEE